MPPSSLHDVTVLFADLEGFSALAERLPVKELVATLNECFCVLTQAALEEGGTVDRFIGDAMLVIWPGPELKDSSAGLTLGDQTADGAPMPDDNPDAATGIRMENAAAAARAALKMIASQRSLQARRLMEGKLPIKVRIGIASGLAVIGAIGCPQRYDLTVIGDVVNLASRLEKLNKHHQTDILVAEATRNRLPADFVIKEIGPVAVSGRTGPTKVFSLLAGPIALRQHPLAWERRGQGLGKAADGKDEATWHDFWGERSGGEAKQEEAKPEKGSSTSGTRSQ